MDQPCDFTRSCCNPGPRVRLQGTAHYYCQAHIRMFAMPSRAGETACELGGSRAQTTMPRVSGRRGWSLGIATTGSWL